MAYQPVMIQTFTTTGTIRGVGQLIALILADATAGAFTLTLPPSAATIGQLLIIKKTDASINAVTVARAGSDTIEGLTTVLLATQYASVMVVTSGSGIWMRMLI